MSRYATGDERLWEGADLPGPDGNRHWVDFDEEANAGDGKEQEDSDAVDNTVNPKDDGVVKPDDVKTDERNKILEAAKLESAADPSFDDLLKVSGTDDTVDQPKDIDEGVIDDVDPDSADSGDDVVLLEAPVGSDGVDALPEDAPGDDGPVEDGSVGDDTGRVTFDSIESDDDSSSDDVDSDDGAKTDDSSGVTDEDTVDQVVDSGDGGEVTDVPHHDGSVEDKVRQIEATADIPVEEPDDGDTALPLPSIGDGDDEGYDKTVVHARPDYVLDGKGDIGSEEFNLDGVLSDAVDHGASDVHIQIDQPIMFRINGIMYKFMKYRPMGFSDMDHLLQSDEDSMLGQLISNEAYSDYVVEKSSDQSYTIKVGPHRGARFRLHIAQTVGGSAYVVFRHIRPEIYTPEEIGLSADVLEWSELSQGLILVTGPTGSGKSSTLSTILRKIQLDRPGNITTLEEPVETIYPKDGLSNVVQREVPTNCRSFVQGISDAMRQDPDVILIGEIRDAETLKAALQACNTGHLTFATIHADSAPDVVTRCIGLVNGEDEQGQLATELSRNLKGVLSQRLLLRPHGDGRIAVREVIHVGREQRMQIASDDIEGLEADLRRKSDDLDSKMVQMLIEGKTTLKSARYVAQDKIMFDAMVDALQPRFRDKIIEDVEVG